MSESLEAVPFLSSFRSDVLALIVGLQRDEVETDITAEQQPDLQVFRHSR
jgi:hypothetical protein